MHKQSRLLPRHEIELRPKQIKEPMQRRFRRAQRCRTKRSGELAIESYRPFGNTLRRGITATRVMSEAAFLVLRLEVDLKLAIQPVEALHRFGGRAIVRVAKECIDRIVPENFRTRLWCR